MRRKTGRLLAAVGVFLGTLQPGGVWAGGDQAFVGEIMWVPYNFAPKNWAFCNGQLLSIAQNTALFSLLGTTYGGNGTTNFALPNAQGMVLINAGQGAGLSDYVQGQTGGEAAVTLTQAEIPVHTHAIGVSTNLADQTAPGGNVLAKTALGEGYSTSASTTMAAGALSVQGGGLPHNNMMPYTTLNCIISLAGIFPQRP